MEFRKKEIEEEVGAALNKLYELKAECCSMIARLEEKKHEIEDKIQDTMSAFRCFKEETEKASGVATDDDVSEMLDHVNALLILRLRCIQKEMNKSMDPVEMIELKKEEEYCRNALWDSNSDKKLKNIRKLWEESEGDME